MAAQSRYCYPATLRGHTNTARRRRPVEPRVDCSSTQQGAQVECVAALSHGDVVSGSGDRTLRVWAVSRGWRYLLLSGHTNSARRRRPAAPRGDRSSTPRGAQVWCVAALPNGSVVSGSADRTLKVWDVSSERCRQTLTGHTDWARRRRPVEPRRRSLVDAARGAGQLCRCPPERPRCVRVVGPQAQGVGRVEG